MTNYTDFIKTKELTKKFAGKKINKDDVNPILFQFQRDAVVWAVGKGRAALFLDTGLGKTFCQLEWARLIGEKTLIIAPLSVARQTVREGEKIGINVLYVRSQEEAINQINITNYEMIDKFEFDDFGAIILDESSILKSLNGVIKKKIIEKTSNTPYRLACSATPAPNDHSEIGNHAEYLGICTSQEMLAMFFVHANKQVEKIINGVTIRIKKGNKLGQEWRIKNHALTKFYKWMASWSLSMTKPSDLGYDDGGYELPKLKVKPIFIKSDYKPDDQLFFTGLHGIQDRHNVRKSTIGEKTSTAIKLVNSNDDQWIVWAGLQAESKELSKILDGAIEVKGSDDPEYKARCFEDFQDGKIRVLVTKSKIGGFGMNFQNCHNMLFFGLDDSWERYYQSIRRVWRFGQTEEVKVYIILSDVEGEIYRNVIRKDALARRMVTNLIKNIVIHERKELEMENDNGHYDYQESNNQGKNWQLMLGDSCQRMKEINDNDIDLSVYSPPFADLYTYSASEFDLGNSRNWGEFFDHYNFIVSDLLRITKPGRLTCVHVSDIPAMASRDGYIGMKDFPGEVIRLYERCGWVFSGRAFVQKNPQAQAIRTKSKALLFVQLRKDSADSRPAIIDQILLFKKPGDNLAPINPVENGEMDNEKWIEWAHGIWLGISETDTLQYSTAREKNDEKHICPLQLGTIERCIKLYSNPGETVFTPFLGIGSEAYQAVRYGRKAIGIELKKSYYDIAVSNLKKCEQEYLGQDLFSFAGITLDNSILDTGKE